MRPFRAIVLLGTMVFLGCENAVDPFSETDGSTPFYVFGYLDTASDTQFVRVEAIRQSHDPDAGIPPTSVRTTASSTGETVVWRDSIVTLTDGTTGHLFFATFRAVAGERYELTVERADGARATATTDVPTEPQTTVDTARVVSNEVVQTVTLAGMSAEPAEIALVYRVSRGDEQPIEIVVDYANRAEVVDGSLTVRVRLSDDRERVAQMLGESASSPEPTLHEVSLRLTLLSSEWATPEAVHVENGRGFWGAVGRFSIMWQLPPHILRRLSFQEPAGLD
ncbi:MAG TPA: hypothetical protein VF190_09500 [Rhodothermales bacterium]